MSVFQITLTTRTTHILFILSGLHPSDERCGFAEKRPFRVRKPLSHPLEYGDVFDALLL